MPEVHGKLPDDLTEHDRAILEEMEVRFKELTGKEATHIFIDTNKTLEIEDD